MLKPLALLAASASGAAVAAPLRPSPAMKPPSYFIDGQRDPVLLSAIRRSAERKIGFDRHFSLAFVPCGAGCGSFWFVDRNTGGVVAAPTPREQDLDTLDVRAAPDSDVIAVTFGPRFESGPCTAQHFRWGGKRFIPVDRRAPARCR